jgi:hypothetical protein
MIWEQQRLEASVTFAIAVGTAVAAPPARSACFDDGWPVGTVFDALLFSGCVQCPRLEDGQGPCAIAGRPLSTRSPPVVRKRQSPGHLANEGALPLPVDLLYC